MVYSQDQLNRLFDSFILSLFVYGLEVLGSARKKHLHRIDNFCKRTYRYGYTAKTDFQISTLIEERDKLLFNKITTTKDHPLQDLMPPKRYVKNVKEKGPRIPTPQIRTGRYKKSFMNRCPFKFLFDCPSLYLIVCYCSLNLFISHNLHCQDSFFTSYCKF